uniref:Transmembrane protein n=1 Tax=Meloidogyne hapla TaxID=6305 RepID=A0A1I8BXL2_MELHA
MSGSISGEKEPIYDEPSAAVLLTPQTAESKDTTESEPLRLRSEKTQKDGYEVIGDIENLSFMESLPRKGKKSDSSAKDSLSYDDTDEETEEKEDEEEAKTAKSIKKSKKKDPPKKKSQRKSKERTEYKLKAKMKWIVIAACATTFSFAFCIYANLVAFASGDKFAPKEYPWLDIELIPFSSIRGSKFYRQHRSTAELPTSACGAEPYDVRTASQDVMARIWTKIGGKRIKL